MITHDMRLIAEYASRALVLRRGKRTFLAAPGELFRGETLGGRRVGRPGGRAQRRPEVELLRTPRIRGRADWIEQPQELAPYAPSLPLELAEQTPGIVVATRSGASPTLRPGAWRWLICRAPESPPIPLVRRREPDTMT